MSGHEWRIHRKALEDGVLAVGDDMSDSEDEGEKEESHGDVSSGEESESDATQTGIRVLERRASSDRTNKERRENRGERKRNPLIPHLSSCSADAPHGQKVFTQGK